MYNSCYNPANCCSSSLDGILYTPRYSQAEDILIQPRETYMSSSVAMSPVSFRPDNYNSISAALGNDFKSYSSIGYQDSRMPSTTTYVRQADAFLNPARPLARFIETESEVQDLVNEAFFSLTGRKLDNAVIKVCKGDESELVKQGFRPGVLGLAINNESLPGIILVRNDFIDRMIVTIGHEIGHIMSPSLSDIRSEEAKAFAFELAWVKKIKELNIGNLGSSLVLPAPANNGIHDAALGFVISRISEGKEPLDIHSELSMGQLRFSFSLDSILG